MRGRNRSVIKRSGITPLSTQRQRHQARLLIAIELTLSRPINLDASMAKSTRGRRAAGAATRRLEIGVRNDDAADIKLGDVDI